MVSDANGCQLTPGSSRVRVPSIMSSLGILVADPLIPIACIHGSNKPLYKNVNYLTSNHKECCNLKLPEIWHTVQWIFLFLSICSYSHTVLSYSQNQLCCLKQLLCGCHEKVEILEKKVQKMIRVKSARNFRYCSMIFFRFSKFAHFHLLY